MVSPIPEYTLLDHTADLAIRVRGKDLKNLFENAAMALMHIMVRGNRSGNTSSVNISLSGQDLADLMVRWLGEVLYLLEGESLVVSAITIRDLTTARLEAVGEVVPFDPDIHEIQTEVKAVTYHQVEVVDKGDQWEARVTFDI
jgi:SHS2 domain-containing protein